MAKFDEKAFCQQYGLSGANAKEGTAIEFKSQDSEYRVYIPGKKADKSTLTLHSNGSLDLTLVQDHIIHVTSHDDHSTVSETFDAKGHVTSLSRDFAIEDGKPNLIPDWVPKALDIGVELLGALGALETAGISEVAAQEVVADINKFCDTFNKIMGKANKLTDDGGRINFPAVIAHNMNKAANAVHV